MLSHVLRRGVELYAAGIVLLGVAKTVKLAGHGQRAPLGPLDHLLWAAAALLLGATVIVPAAAALPILLCGLFVFIGLWLDALLYRVFTIELGPGGVGSVVIAVLYEELAEMEMARRFWRENRVFALLPLGALLAMMRPLLPPDGPWDLANGALLASYLVAAIAVVRPALLGRTQDPPVLRTFLWARRLPVEAGFAARPEHVHMIAPDPVEPPPSDRFGKLRGASVLLVTIESLGRAYLRRARLPTLERLAAGAVVSRRHFCICPTTNDSHTALYFGAYRPNGVSAIAGLGEAGLRTIYVSPTRTSLYGLEKLLRRAGFHEIVDAVRLRPREGRAQLDDWVLVDQGVEAIAAAARGGRFFAHVHTTLTHVPYRVAEPAFRRRPDEGDLGRFLDALEEADAVLAALLAALEAKGLLEDTLVIVSGDHGQSFGELGYWSHASAITAEQIDVPLVLCHPRLAPATIEVSTHFDVLPTAYDLLGLRASAGLGASIFLGRPAEVLLWAGQPSRGSTSCFGVVHGDRKWMVDVVRDRCLQMTRDDGDPVELHGPERRYWQSLCSAALLARGLR